MAYKVYKRPNAYDRTMFKANQVKWIVCKETIGRDKWGGAKTRTYKFETIEEAQEYAKTIDSSKYDIKIKEVD